MAQPQLNSQPRLAEAELVRRAVGKDESAIRAIIQANNRRLYRVARSIVRDDSEAEDVVQEAYLRAFSALPEFRGELSLATLAHVTSPLMRPFTWVSRSTSARGVTAPAFAADGPTDPQIAHIAYTAGAIDVKAAQQALQISKNADVRAFANDMVRDHTAVNDKALALVKKLSVTPEDNDTSKALTKQADDKQAELAKLSGADFDKAYVDNEVAYHKTVDGALSTTLIPSSSNGELKSLLKTGLKIFEAT